MLLANALVDASHGSIPVRMMAVSPGVRLKRGCVIGYVDDNVDTVTLATMQTVCESSAGKAPDFDLSDSALSDQEKSSLTQMLNRHASVFSAGDHDLGRTSLVTHDIPTETGRPQRKANYRQAFHLRQEANRQVDVLLKNGVVEPSTSPWSSPVLMVPKKDGSYRFCVDFRSLNSITQRAEYPCPRVDECLESMSGACIFTTLDLAAGYWQVEVNSRDRPKSLSVCDHAHGALWRPCHLPTVDGPCSAGSQVADSSSVPR